MINSITWNVRGINTQGFMERIKNLKTIHHIDFISILEPFCDSSQLIKLRIQLNMEYDVHNPNSKIWLFWTKEVDYRILKDQEQQITCQINHVMWPKAFMVTFVYAKCKDLLRRSHWDKMLNYSNTDMPWCSIGGLNVITSPEEK